MSTFTIHGKPNGIIYGVRQETLAAYVKAERVKVWEKAAMIAEQCGVHPALNVANGGPEWYRHGKDIATLLRAQAVKETL